jgi:acetyl esterase
MPTVDPQLIRFIEGVAAAYARHPPFETLTPPEARAVAEEVRKPWAMGGPQMARTQERTIALDGDSVRIRVYSPTTHSPLPALVYIHGGGWMIFSLDTHDRLMREYAAGAGIAVVGIDYSLSPEAKFPVAIEETTAVVRWLAEHGQEVGIDGSKLVIGGDSAGAHISAATAIKLRDEGASGLFSGMVLNYGAFDTDFTQPSYAKYGGGEYTLSLDEIHMFWKQHLGEDGAKDNLLARPLRADLRGLPSAFLVITEIDPIHDDSIAMTDALRAAGVDVTATVYPGTTHGFLEAMSIAEVSRRAIADTSRWLAHVLGG